MRPNEGMWVRALGRVPTRSKYSTTMANARKGTLTQDDLRGQGNARALRIHVLAATRHPPYQVGSALAPGGTSVEQKPDPVSPA